jgi:hypothetical protein
MTKQTSSSTQEEGAFATKKIASAQLGNSLPEALGNAIAALELE